MMMIVDMQVLMGRTGPLDKLSRQRPPGSLVTGPTLASILAQVRFGHRLGWSDFRKYQL